MDAIYAEILVILDVVYEDRTVEAVAMLVGVGMTVNDVDEEQSVVGGQVELHRLPAVRELACVDYVRQVFTYDANFPPGDPRDRDGT